MFPTFSNTTHGSVKVDLVEVDAGKSPLGFLNVSEGFFRLGKVYYTLSCCNSDLAESRIGTQSTLGSTLKNTLPYEHTRFHIAKPHFQVENYYCRSNKMSNQENKSLVLTLEGSQNKGAYRDRYKTFIRVLLDSYKSQTRLLQESYETVIRIL